jgi:hypothetical protein
MKLNRYNNTLFKLNLSVDSNPAMDLYIEYTEKDILKTKSLKVLSSLNILQILKDEVIFKFLSIYNNDNINHYFTLTLKDYYLDTLDLEQVVGSFTLKPNQTLRYSETNGFQIFTENGYLSSGDNFYDTVNWDTAYSWGDHALAGYLTSTLAASTYAPISHTHTFASLTSIPTTLAGYGITDAYPLSGNPSGYLTSSSLAGYVPYTGATGNLQLAANNLTFTTGRISFGTNSGTSLINFPDANSSTNGINFGNNVLLYQGTSPLLVCSSSFAIGASGLILTASNIYRNGSGFELGRYGGGGNLNMYANNTTLVQTLFSSTGNVSIGTTSDLSRLAVRGSSSTTGLAALIQNSTPSDLFSVLNNGNVGVGTSSPTSKLHVIGSSYFTGGHMQLAAGSYFYTEMIRSISASDNNISLGTSSSGITFNLHTASVDGYRWYKYATQLMQLTPSGSLGVNSTDFGSGGHTFQLSVSGNIKADRMYCNTFRDSPGNNTWAAITGTLPNQTLTFGNGGVSSIYTPFGSFGIGISSGVSATLHVRGNSVSTGSAFLVQNSTPTDLFTVDNTGKIGLRPTNFELWFGTIGNASYANLKQVSGVLTLQAPNNSSTINLNGGIIGDYLIGANVYGVNITNVVNTRTITGTYSLLRLFQYISPTSGISNTNFLEISGTIQQTGGANGITRGILIAPTLTAAADFRGLEIVTGNNAAHTLIKLNNGAQDVFCVKGDKTIIMNIPTSSAGLPSGALWNDSGTLKIV